jgi:hypothetical protein
VVVPVVIPVIDPVIASTVPIAGFDDAHVPPGVVVVNVPVAPWHTCNEPPIADGNAYTVTICVTRHVVGNV